MNTRAVRKRVSKLKKRKYHCQELIYSLIDFMYGPVWESKEEVDFFYNLLVINLYCDLCMAQSLKSYWV